MRTLSEPIFELSRTFCIFLWKDRKPRLSIIILVNNVKKPITEHIRACLTVGPLQNSLSRPKVSAAYKGKITDFLTKSRFLRTISLILYVTKTHRKKSEPRAKIRPFSVPFCHLGPNPYHVQNSGPYR